MIKQKKQLLYEFYKTSIGIREEILISEVVPQKKIFKEILEYKNLIPIEFFHK